MHNVAAVLIAGGGLAGASAARTIADSGMACVQVVEGETRVGGNVVDDRIVEGVRVHEHGPHAFHTESSVVRSFVTRFADWRPYEHRVLAHLNSGIQVPVPFNFSGLEKLFPKESSGWIRDLTSHFGDEKRVSLDRLFRESMPGAQAMASAAVEFIFKGYSEKMWGVGLDQLGASVRGRVPVCIGYDDRYFTDSFQALPVGGYSSVVREMLNHQRISVEVGRRVKLSDLQSAKAVVFTGSLDELFDFRRGVLEYRSLEFRDQSRVPWTHSVAQVNFTQGESFTRSVNYSVIQPGSPSPGRGPFVLEFPQDYEPGKNRRYYPLRHVPEMSRLHNAYVDDFVNEFPRGQLAGRLAQYQYLNMDQAIASGIRAGRNVLRTIGEGLAR